MQQIIRDIQTPVVTQDLSNIGRTHETNRQMILAVLDVTHQFLNGERTPFLWQQIEVQGQTYEVCVPPATRPSGVTKRALKAALISS
jgi:hypothetical protein